MADWFDFKGIRSTSLGVTMQTPPPVTLAEERAKFETIPGSSGSLTLLEGDAVYEDIVLSVDCYVRDLTNLDAIAAWLRGSGDLVLGNQPTRYYKARCVNQIELAKVLRGRQHRTFPAVFRCQPYRYTCPAPAALTYLPLVNLVTNGHFTSTTSPWTTTNATLSAVSGEGVMLASAQNGVVNTTLGALVAGRKYYAAAKIKASSALVRLVMGAGTPTYHPGNNQYVRLSLTFTATGTGHQLYVYDGRASGWNNVYIDDVVCIDLVAAFGAGNEPTTAQMDAYMADRYPNSWFNGTASGGQIVNPATADAVPLITVVGSGNIDLTVGGRTIHIDTLASSITIDAETGMAYNGTTDLTSKVTLDYYPWVIPPGTAAISWTGTVTSVTINAPWRYI